jgi:hypothetical protein
LVEKSDGKRPLGRPGHRWEDVKMNITETGWDGVDWIHLAQEKDRWWALLKNLMEFRVL